MNKWEGIEAFVQVVDQGSFSRAAETLGVSKSHVSRQVSTLETRLDAQLLIRTTRKLTLTEVGSAFYQRCTGLLDGLREAEQAVMELQEKPRGNLRLTTVGGFGEDFVVPAALKFMERYPEVRVHVEFTNRLVDLISEGYDLAIRSGILQDSSLIARRIANRNLMICGSPAYFERYGRPTDINALVNHNCLLGTQPTWRFRQGGRNFDLKVDGNWRSNSGRALLRAACDGIGLTQLPHFYVSHAVAAGELESVLDNFRPEDAAFWAVYPHNRHLSAKVRLFINFLVAWLENDTPTAP